MNLVHRISVSRFAVLVTLVHLVIFISPAAAGFELVPQAKSKTTGASTYTVQLVFSPKQASRVAPANSSSVYTEEALLEAGFDEIEAYLMSKVENTPKNRTIRQDSTVVALPQEAESWSVIVDGKSSTDYTVEPGFMGPIPFLQVTAGEVVFSRGLKEEIELRVEFSKGRKSESKLIDENSDLRRNVSSLFINGADIQTYPARGVPGGLLPEPPGTRRIAYTEGDEIIRVPQSELSSSLPLSSSSTRLVHHGQLVSFALDSSDIWFYAPRRHTLTDIDDSIFYSEDSANPSSPMGTRAAFSTVSPGGVEVERTRYRMFDKNLRYERGSIQPLNDRFVYWRARENNSYTEELAVDDVLTTTGLDVRLRLLGFSLLTPDPDSFADFFIEGEPVVPGVHPYAQVTWDGRQEHIVEERMYLPTLPNPADLTFTHSVPPTSAIPPGQSFIIHNLDTVELTWTGYPRISPLTGSTQIDIEASVSSQVVTVGGFPIGTIPSDIVVLDITNPYSPVQLTGLSVFTDSTGTVAVEFESPAGAARTYHVQSWSDVETTPLVEDSDSLPSLPASGEVLGGIIVRHDNFDAAVDPLASYYENSILELDPQAAYNVYNGGQQAPSAISQALADIIETAESSVPFPYVLLIGHGSLDPRNYLGTHDGAQIHPYVEDSIASGGIPIENPIDHYYGAILGNDQLVDVYLTRIPARYPADLDAVINRNSSYELISESLKQLPRKGVFLTDDDPLFLNDTPNLISLWEQNGKPSLRIDKTSPNGSSGTVEYNAIQDALESDNGGASFFLYTGHGNVDIWSGTPVILRSSDIPNINTEDKWPVMATFTCLNAYYAFPSSTASESLSSAWIMTDTVGAIASIAPCSIDLYFEQSIYSEEVVSVLGNIAYPPKTVGELMLRSRNGFLSKYPIASRTGRVYLLFGDPQAELSLNIDLSVDDWKLISVD